MVLITCCFLILWLVPGRNLHQLTLHCMWLVSAKILLTLQISCYWWLSCFWCFALRVARTLRDPNFAAFKLQEACTSWNPNFCCFYIACFLHLAMSYICFFIFHVTCILQNRSFLVLIFHVANKMWPTPCKVPFLLFLHCTVTDSKYNKAVGIIWSSRSTI